MKLEENKNWIAVKTANVRAYRFTHHDYTPEVENRIQSLKGVRYMVYGYETCPTTKRPHLQGFIFFKNVREGKLLIKQLPGTILFTCDASAISNSEYCKKEKDIGYEFGECPMSKEEKGNSAKVMWAEVYKLAKAGDLDTIEIEYPALLFHKHKDIMTVYNREMMKKVPVTIDGDMPGIWIIGDAGTGKSATAREMSREHFRCDDPYIKVANHIWWTNYRYQDTVIIDDLDPSCKSLSYEFKTWIDRYKVPVRIHGDMIDINPRNIIVTSQYSIEECFDDLKVRDAMLRRFPTVIRMTQEDGDEIRASHKRKFEAPTPQEAFGDD